MSRLKTSGTSTLKAQYWIASRHSALSRPVLLSRNSSKQPQLVSTAPCRRLVSTLRAFQALAFSVSASFVRGLIPSRGSIPLGASPEPRVRPTNLLKC
jgi:hypothetical protein